MLSVEERFWSKVDKRGPDECWPWTGSIIVCTGNIPRGEFWFRGKNWSAHRVAYVLTYGEIPEGLGVLHSCDDSICCNPKHLHSGTQQDNLTEMRARGRGHNPPYYAAQGSLHGNAKLTESAVVAIRRDRAQGTLCKEIAERYGIHKSHVSNICGGRAWKHVK